MKTKLDIAIERIILMVSDQIHGYSDEERIAREIKWEITGAIKEMTFEEMAEFVASK